MTIKPSRFNLWVTSIIFLAVAATLLSSDYQNLVQHALGEAWFVGAFGAGWIAFAFLTRSACIHVDDSAIPFGPRLLARSSYDRRGVACTRPLHGSFDQVSYSNADDKRW